MKARETVRLAGGRGMEFEIQAYCFSSQNSIWKRDAGRSTYRAEACKCQIQEEQAEVLRSEALSKHKYEAADDTDRQRIDVEPESVLAAVRCHGVGVRVEDDEDIALTREQL